jgi:hypothetical protein
MGDEGVGAEIDVQHRALRALEENVGAGATQVLQGQRHIRDQRRDRLAVLEQLIERLLEIHRRLAEIVLQHEIVEVQHFTELCREAVALEEIRDADGAARHFVLVGGSDAAAGGADGVGSAGLLACLVEQDVRRQDQRTIRRDAQALEHRHALLHQHAALRKECLQREHDAVADEATRILAEDAGRNQGKDGLAAADDQRMPGVVTTLEARHGGGTLRQQIDDFTFALIAPLGADDDDEFAHVFILPAPRRSAPARGFRPRAAPR